MVKTSTIGNQVFWFIAKGEIFFQVVRVYLADRFLLKT